ncbi:hypothetical protein K0M31_015896 [Melipona bicolor]|uniref:Uncharacterized protein n=1 Tax=Melipona bicolor TaxID=60889 RepID=A0AA40G673_9HYME|nr:hypothetical protein K0M31_015896 [Melipona bicolor]
MGQLGVRVWYLRGRMFSWMNLKNFEAQYFAEKFQVDFKSTRIWMLFTSKFSSIVPILCVKHTSFTSKYDHSNIAVYIWHPLSDETPETPKRHTRVPIATFPPHSYSSK